jgi:transcription antitermination factor NusG
MNHEKHWLVIYTKPRAEKKVNERLLEEGFETYLPLQKVIRQWSDRKKKVEVPLFNSYVFIKANEKDRFKILEVYGVVRFIFYLGKPAIVREFEIENIKEFLNKTKGSNITFKINERVEITEGPLRGKAGKIEQLGKNTIKLSIEQLGISLIAQVHKSTVRQLA